MQLPGQAIEFAEGHSCREFSRKRAGFGMPFWKGQIWTLILGGVGSFLRRWMGLNNGNEGT